MSEDLTYVDRSIASIDRLMDRTQWVRTYPEGRVCSYPGCGTRLSRYNPDAVCAAHRPEPPLAYHGYRFAICEDCGEVFETRGRARHRLCIKCRRRAPKPTPPRSKDCSWCRKPKPIDQFRLDPHTKDGHTYVCRECLRAHESSDARKAKRRERYAERKRLRALESNTVEETS